MRHLVPLCAPSLLTSLSHGSGSCPLWTLPGLFASDYALPLLHHTYLGGSHVLSYLFLFFTQIGDVDGTEINGSTNICPIFFFKKYFFPKKIEVWIFKSLCMLVIKSNAWFLGYMTRTQGSGVADNSQGPQPWAVSSVHTRAARDMHLDITCVGWASLVEVCTLGLWITPL